MFDGSTTGRAFESAASPYALGAITVVSVSAWLWFRYLIRDDDRDE